MLTRNQYLLVCLAEECGEVQRAIGKALRFGMDDLNPNTMVSAENHLKDEMADLLAILKLVEEELDLPIDPEAIKQKGYKIERYYKYAYLKGCVS
jgi:NTP pyrophosphatase (non-canonical NTP hydrolase)